MESTITGPGTPELETMLRTIADYVAEHGYSPALADLDEAGYRDRARRRLLALKADGWVDRADGVVRSIRLTPKAEAWLASRVALSGGAPDSAKRAPVAA